MHNTQYALYGKQSFYSDFEEPSQANFDSMEQQEKSNNTKKNVILIQTKYITHNMYGMTGKFL